MFPLNARFLPTSAARLLAVLMLAAPLVAPAQQAPAAKPPAAGPEAPWPRTVQSGDTTLTIYQPQIDSWNGFDLVARAAVQATVGKDQAAAQFGIVSLEAKALVDKGKRLVVIDDAKVTQADFPAAPGNAATWGNLVARDLAGRSRTMALDRLEASLAILDTQKAAEKAAPRNGAPRIVFSPQPAILVSIDGSPTYRPVAGTPYERVINTRPLLLRDASGQHYLKVFDGWLSAASLEAAWSVLKAPPAALTQAFKSTSAAHLIDPLTGQASTDQPAPTLKQGAPAMVIATSPTELVVTDGPPKYVPIAGTKLLYVDNTTGNLFKDTGDNRSYLLLAGRWFRAATEAGPWDFVAANALPTDFARIPDDSAKENVKASVAGTVQAREAAIAATVPQTAAVKVAGTTVTPPIAYDGEPMLKAIEGTSLEYVANSPTPVIRVAANSFYAVQNGVWFTAASLRGPWAVATTVPTLIYSIPVSSSLHYVTYVKVYSVTPDVVYVGYTPGYMGTYVDPVTGVVVYGTGYVYDPWVGAVWYGAPVTYGYAASVAYTPWAGWAVAFGLGWWWGASTAGWWGWGPYPYWGPWGYPAWYGVAWGPGGGAVAWGPGGWAGYSGNIYTQWGARSTVSRVGGGYNAWTGNAWASRVGVSYNSRTGVASAGQRGAVANAYTGNYAAGGRGVAVGPNGNVIAGGRGTAGNAYNGNEVSGNRGAFYNKSTGEVTKFGSVSGNNGGTVGHVGDDVYAGKDGNIYRNTGDGWQQHTQGGGWEPVAGSGQGEATRNATGGLGESNRTQELDRERTARQTGADRSSALGQSRQNLNRSFGGMHGGGMHGGGMRRR